MNLRVFSSTTLPTMHTFQQLEIYNKSTCRIPSIGEDYHQIDESVLLASIARHRRKVVLRGVEIVVNWVIIVTHVKRKRRLYCRLTLVDIDFGSHDTIPLTA